MIQLSDSSGDVVIGGKPYRVGGDAVLDYALRALVTPIDHWMYRLQGKHHPLGVTASISAASPEALGEPVFTCFRVTRGTETWSRRPITYGTQTLADAYPPGATPAAENEAWRQAYAGDGPEWSAGEVIALEVWVNVEGSNYVVRVPPFRLTKGL